MAFLLEAIRLALIKLQIMDRNISQRPVHESFAAIARRLEQVEHGAFFDITEPRRGAHGISFRKAAENHGHFLYRKPHVRTERLWLWLRESLAAMLAFPPLHFLRSVKSGFDHLGTAVVAGHAGHLDACFLRASASK